MGADALLVGHRIPGGLKQARPSLPARGLALNVSNTLLNTNKQAALIQKPAERSTMTKTSEGPTWYAPPELYSPESQGSELDDLDSRKEGYVLKWPNAPVDRIEAPNSSSPVIILPGFANNFKDYIYSNTFEDTSFVQALKNRGFSPYVLDLHRRDWLRVTKAFFTAKYWAGEATTAQGYYWYLERVAQLVEKALKETGAETVDIVAHSAGGWLARSFVGDTHWRCTRDQRRKRVKLMPDSYFECADSPHPLVKTLVTLGSPHAPPVKGKHVDMTGGALQWVNINWPHAHFHQQGLKYVCVSSRTVKGSLVAPPNSLQRYAHSTYSMVCGNGEEVGDCVVPLRTAHMDGAMNITLQGVVHSVANLDKAEGAPWYGSDRVVDHWLHALVSD